MFTQGNLSLAELWRGFVEFDINDIKAIYSVTVQDLVSAKVKKHTHAFPDIM